MKNTFKENLDSINYKISGGIEIVSGEKKSSSVQIELDHYENCITVTSQRYIGYLYDSYAAETGYGILMTKEDIKIYEKEHFGLLSMNAYGKGTMRSVEELLAKNIINSTELIMSSQI